MIWKTAECDLATAPDCLEVSGRYGSTGELRQAVSKLGWRLVGGRDICPRCGPQKKPKSKREPHPKVGKHDDLIVNLAHQGFSRSMIMARIGMTSAGMSAATRRLGVDKLTIANKKLHG